MIYYLDYYRYMIVLVEGGLDIPEESPCFKPDQQRVDTNSLQEAAGSGLLCFLVDLVLSQGHRDEYICFGDCLMVTV